MSAKHTSPEWHRTTRIVKAQVRAKRGQGKDVVCWRCGRPLGEEEPYDVGHIDPNGGEGVDNAAPEHRKKSGTCIGNRAHGGRLGAQRTNAKKAATSGRSTFRPLPWA